MLHPGARDDLRGDDRTKILHTSDWHLGRSLEGRSRLPEQAAFIDELCDIVEEHRVDLVLVAGDVFDTYNPSADAEELYFSAVERLAAGGKRAVVLVAGNHDSPDRLCAANPLALRHGIFVVGRPGEKLPDVRTAEGRAAMVGNGRGWIEVAIPGCSETAVICTLPYPSEARLGEVISDDLDEARQQLAYSERVKRLLDETANAFRDNTVNLVAGHLFMLGGLECESERPIQLGGALVVEAGALPARAHYVALGHLHRPQEIHASPVPCRYSGSPLSYSFSEADQQKEVVVVEATPGQAAAVQTVKLTAGKALRRWKAESLAEAESWCREPQNRGCWVDLEIRSDSPLSTAQLAQLRKDFPEIISIRVILPETSEARAERRLSKMTLAEQFTHFVRRYQSADPSEELVRFFLEMVNEPDATDDEPEGSERAGGISA